MDCSPTGSCIIVCGQGGHDGYDDSINKLLTLDGARLLSSDLPETFVAQFFPGGAINVPKDMSGTDRSNCNVLTAQLQILAPIATIRIVRAAIAAMTATVIKTAVPLSSSCTLTDPPHFGQGRFMFLRWRRVSHPQE